MKTASAPLTRLESGPRQCGPPGLRLHVRQHPLRPFRSFKPFFTSRGSFWSSCTTELLASSTDEERQARTRNRCNGEGYESVALVPLRSHGETFGLFQFNDRRRGRFTAEKIALYEDLVAYVAIALAKLRVDEALLESSRFSQQIIDSAEEGIIVYDRDMRYQVWNPFMEKLAGRMASEVIGRHPLENFPYLRGSGVIENIRKALSGQSLASVEFAYQSPKPASYNGSQTPAFHFGTRKEKSSALSVRCSISPSASLPRMN